MDPAECGVVTSGPSVCEGERDILSLSMVSRIVSGFLAIQFCYNQYFINSALREYPGVRLKVRRTKLSIGVAGVIATIGIALRKAGRSRNCFGCCVEILS